MIEEAAAYLLAGTMFMKIVGASHASFGDYGEQQGDRQATASDAQVQSIIAKQIKLLLLDSNQEAHDPENR